MVAMNEVFRVEGEIVGEIEMEAHPGQDYNLRRRPQETLLSRSKTPVLLSRGREQENHQLVEEIHE